MDPKDVIRTEAERVTRYDSRTIHEIETMAREALKEQSHE